MRQLVDDRHPDLVGEVVRVREVLLERQAEERDPVRHRRPVGAPFGPRRALVQAVHRVVGPELVLAPLVVGGLVGDDDRDLVEGGRVRLGDGVERPLDELLERAVTWSAGDLSGTRGGV